MPINNIPGVGPTNADIATAVAAPSAATIAAAVAAPSAATIASAVAAPSAATIASAVAAAVPTTAGITSIVQANAGSPFGGSWTFLSSQNPASSTISFTGLSGYKKYRLYIFTYKSGTAYTLNCRINSLASNQYAYITKISRNAQANAYVITGSGDSSLMDLTPGGGITDGFTCYGYIDFDQASSGQYKTIDWKGGYFQTGTNTQTHVEGTCYVRETAAINRIDIGSNTALGTLSTTGFWLFGGN